MDRCNNCGKTIVLSNYSMGGSILGLCKECNKMGVIDKAIYLHEADKEKQDAKRRKQNEEFHNTMVENRKMYKQELKRSKEAAQNSMDTEKLIAVCEMLYEKNGELIEELKLYKEKESDESDLSKLERFMNVVASDILNQPVHVFSAMHYCGCCKEHIYDLLNKKQFGCSK